MTRVRGGEDANRSAALSFNAAFFRLQEDSDEDDDKENHPESGKRHRSNKGKLLIKNDDKVRGLKDYIVGFEVFRGLRI